MARFLKTVSIRRKLSLEMDECHKDDTKNNVCDNRVIEGEIDTNGNDAEQILELSAISETIAATSNKKVKIQGIEKILESVQEKEATVRLDLAIQGVKKCPESFLEKDETVRLDLAGAADRGTRYKLRETPKKKYFDGEDDEDYSPDCSEYLPSPDRTATISSSTSSLAGDLQALDDLLLHNNINILRTPSTVSRLSQMLDTDGSNSPDTTFSTPKQVKQEKYASNKLKRYYPLVDITLKPQQNVQIPDIEVEKNLEQTLTPNKTFNELTVNTVVRMIDSNIPFISPEKKSARNENNLSNCKPKLTENKENTENNTTEYVIYNYDIVIEIEPEFPEDDNLAEPISDAFEKKQSEIDIQPEPPQHKKDEDDKSERKDDEDKATSNNANEVQKERKDDEDEVCNIASDVQKKRKEDEYEACNIVNEVQKERKENDDKTCHSADKVQKERKEDEECNANEIQKERKEDEDEACNSANQVQKERKEDEDEACNSANEVQKERKENDDEACHSADEVQKERKEDEECNANEIQKERKEDEDETCKSANEAQKERKEDEDEANNSANEVHDDFLASGSENRDPLPSKKLTRKRKRDVSEWRDNKNKLLKNSGEAYEGTRTKKKMKKKTALSSCVCSKMCGLKFDAEQRQAIHKKFYKLAHREQQWLFVLRHVKTQDVKRVTVMREKNRTQTIQYYLPLNGEEIQVCKVFFLRTLSISEDMVYTAIEKNKKDESFTDNRGKHQNRPHKMQPSTEASVITHINMFPKVESHYTRKESKREYLSESLNISKMYRLYKEWFTEQNYTEDVQIASKRQYTTVFNTKYNYSFFQPKKDQCTLCAKYTQAESNEKSSMEEQYTTHLKRKERIRDMKKEEKKMSDKTNTVLAIFDLEKVLNVPQSEVSIFHYKRKYPVYNFTVFDALNKHGYCYVWHAQNGNKGCIEIGSCLLNFMRAEHKKGIRKFLFYSDGCYGQNKNRYIFALYVYAAKTLQLEITHRFFVTGHSQNEGDSMHACIERNMKNKVIYTPDQIYGIILNAKVTGEKYALNEMSQAEFLDIKKLVVPRKWLQDKNGEKVRWSEVMEVSVSQEKPNCFQFKYDFDEEYSELDNNPQNKVRNRQRRGQIPQQMQLIDNTELKPAYEKPIPISKALYKDLQSLCSSAAIPRHYHGFYQSLSYGEEEEEEEEE